MTDGIFSSIGKVLGIRRLKCVVCPCALYIKSSHNAWLTETEYPSVCAAVSGGHKNATLVLWKSVARKPR